MSGWSAVSLSGSVETSDGCAGRILLLVGRLNGVDGCRVGVLVGTRLGLRLGEKVGSTDGLVVGTSDGSIDGCEVGSADGWKEGT